MPAARITKLSKWFTPETESCDIHFNLEGSAERADAVEWDVWASKYQKASGSAVEAYRITREQIQKLWEASVGPHLPEPISV